MVPDNGIPQGARAVIARCRLWSSTTGVRAVILFVACATMARPIEAQTLFSVQFLYSSKPAYTGVAVFGNTGDQWNKLPIPTVAYGGTYPVATNGIKDVTGSTAAGVTFSNPAGLISGVAGYANFLGIAVHPISAPGQTFTYRFANLPPNASCDLVAYTYGPNGTTTTTGRGFDISVNGGATYKLLQDVAGLSSSNLYGSVLTGTNTYTGDYIRLDDVSADGTGALNIVLTSQPGQWQMDVTGFQLRVDSAPPVAIADSATLHSGQKALINVLANDTGSITPAGVTIEQAPQFGTAAPDATGRILYSHTSGAPASDSFTYRASGPVGTSLPATVSIQFSTSLRVANGAFNVPGAPPPTAIAVANAFSGLTFSQPVCMASPPDDTQRLFVCEKTGVLKLIPNVTAATPTQSVFLNLPTLLTSRGESLNAGGEQGLLGLAFHPSYAVNRYFYIFYSVTRSGATYQRVSRFTTQVGNPNAADTSSERILLEQFDEASNHNGGGLAFGPDGYLYISVGDEGGGDDTYNNSQRINRDFFSGMLRIDVDKKAGSLNPNNHAAVLRDAGVARYAVPPDNPYVGATSFNGVAITPASVRTELWAVGLRNPWRFSFDPATGDLWCADVGQNAYEEIDLLTRGGNYGWAYREAVHAGPKTPPFGFSSIDPIYEYPHGSGTFQGNSVTGGIVYRGAKISSLVGAYVFADYSSGNIWALRYDATTVQIERIAGYSSLVAFAPDPSNGDVLMASIYEGTIRRLVSTPAVGAYPQTLSATGVFADLSDLAPNPGLLPYEPNLAFWSDFAAKRRWFAMPDAASRMTWFREGPWTLPTGMLWVKHFDLETTRGNPATSKRIETRVLVKTAAGAYGVSYRWNDAQTDATLVADEGVTFPVNIVDNGVPLIQNWQIPSRANCVTCHNTQAGSTLSFNTRQLNRANTMNGFSGNQIDLLSGGGYFANLPEPTISLPRHARPDETTQPVEDRARSYLAVNCAYCHMDGGTAPTAWDGRPELNLAQTGLINGSATSNGGNPANKLIVPGDPAHSIVLSRISLTNGFTRMPPLASNELDAVDISLITNWINQLPPDTGAPPSPTAAAARKSHGAGGSFEIPISVVAGTAPPVAPLPVECRVGTAFNLVITFNKSVISGGAAVTQGTGLAGAPSFNGPTMIVPLTGVANIQALRIKLTDVTAADGGVLASARADLRVLQGDADGDGKVSSTDTAPLRAAYATSAGEAGFNPRADLNADGVVDAADLTAIRINYGAQAP